MKFKHSIVFSAVVTLAALALILLARSLFFHASFESSLVFLGVVFLAMTLITLLLETGIFAAVSVTVLSAVMLGLLNESSLTALAIIPAYGIMMMVQTTVRRSLVVGLAALALHWMWIMFVIRWTGGVNGDTTQALTWLAALIALLVLWVLCYCASEISNRWIASSVAGVVFAIVSMLLGATLIGGIARVFTFGIPYLLVSELQKRK
jgi:hypothetical protein